MATPPESLQPLYAGVVGPPRRGGLGERSFGELRTMRTDCEHAEAAVSFTRRVLHGRLDLLASEEQRRHPAPDEGEAGHAADGVDGLNTAPADDNAAKGPRARTAALREAAGAADQLTDLLEQLRTSLAGSDGRAVPAPDGRS